MNDWTACIVDSWERCKVITQGKPGGKSRGALTMDEAEKNLDILVQERNQRLAKKVEPKKRYFKSSMEHLKEFL